MNTTIDILLAKYFANNITKAEKREVELWRDASDENQKHFNHYQQLWNRASRVVDMDDGQVEVALKAVKKRMSFNNVKKTNWRIIWQVAAMLIVSVGLTVIYHIVGNVGDSSDIRFAMQEVTAITGGSTELKLPDGSNVHLFSGSKLLFPVEFSSKERQVQLVGEGFFEVVHNTQSPFIVRTAQLNIKVLGTSFNVRAYGDVVETVLVEGKVALEQEVAGHTQVLGTLIPNQRSIYNHVSKSLVVVDEHDVEKYTGWIAGRLIFDGTPLAEVVRQLEKWYHVKIKIIDDRIKTYKITGEFKEEPLEEVLKLIQLTSPIEYKIEKTSAEKNGKSMMKKVLLTGK